MKIISLILVAAIIFTSCTKSENKLLDNTNNIITSPKNNFTLYDYPYNRPDLEEISENTKQLLNLIIISENETEALNNAKKIIFEINRLESLLNLNIGKILTADADLSEKSELLFLLNNNSFITNLKYSLNENINISPHKAYILKNLTDTEKYMLFLTKYIHPMNYQQNRDLNSAIISIYKSAFNEDKILLNLYKNFLTDNTYILSDNLKSEILAAFLKIQGYRFLNAQKNNFDNSSKLYFKNNGFAEDEIKMLIKHTKDYILPLCQKYEENLNKLHKENSVENDIFITAEKVSPFSQELLKICEKRKTLFLDKSKLSLPFPLYISELSAPLILFSTETDFDNTITNRILGQSLYLSCGNGVRNKMMKFFSGFAYDIMAKKNPAAAQSTYYCLKEIVLFSFLTELYLKTSYTSNLTKENYKSIFTDLFHEYFPEKENEDSLLYLSSLILSLIISPADLLVASVASFELSIIKSLNPDFARDSFSSMLISGNIKDLKTFLRSIGLNSPFNANTIKSWVYFYEELLTDAIVETAEEKT